MTKNESKRAYPSPSHVEVDKVPGAWVLTYWLPDGVTLRLKIQHSSGDDPDDVSAQVRLQAEEEFQTLGEFTISVYGIMHADEDPEAFEGLPTIWTRELKRLTRVWARLMYVAEFGPTYFQRYASEPLSSVDHLSPSRIAETLKNSRVPPERIENSEDTR